MNRYERRIDDLQGQIRDKMLLRDAQRADSLHHERFQRQIHDLTDELVLLENAAPRLAELDDQIEHAHRDAVAAQSAADHQQSGMWRFAGIVGGIAALLLVVCVAASPPGWLVVVTILFVIASVAALVIGAKIRRAHSVRVVEAEFRLNELTMAHQRATPDGPLAPATNDNTPTLQQLVPVGELEQ